VVSFTPDIHWIESGWAPELISRFLEDRLYCGPNLANSGTARSVFTVPRKLSCLKWWSGCSSISCDGLPVNVSFMWSNLIPSFCMKEMYYYYLTKMWWDVKPYIFVFCLRAPSGPTLCHCLSHKCVSLIHVRLNLQWFFHYVIFLYSLTVGKFLLHLRKW
jgi:hypothetical protein